MLLRIYSVFDIKAQAFLSPFFMRADGEAIRAFDAALEDEKHQFHKNREDYALFRIGEFEDGDGAIKPEAVPVPIRKGVEVLDA